MRAILVGGAAERDRLKSDLPPGVEVVGEFASIGAARSARLAADVYLLSAQPPEGGPIIEPLTPREIEVLGLLVEGLSNKSIAVRLGTSDQTVKFHVASISGKLGAANRTDAVRRAIRRGLVTV
jgi:DNA-binding NarL/FixJ family response regulator